MFMKYKNIRCSMALIVVPASMGQFTGTVDDLSHPAFSLDAPLASLLYYNQRHAHFRR
jgi:hypothetical protein